MQQEPEVLEKLRKFFRQSTKAEPKFEKSDIELFVVAASEDADEADEITIEEIVIVSIIETVLEEADEITIEEIVINSIRGV